MNKTVTLHYHDMTVENPDLPWNNLLVLGVFEDKRCSQLIILQCWMYKDKWWKVAYPSTSNFPEMIELPNPVAWYDDPINIEPLEVKE